MSTQSQIAGNTSGQYAVTPVQWLILLLVVLFLFTPAHLLAEDQRGAFKVIEAEMVRGEEAWMLNARIEINLSSGVREALENGVPLVFDLQVQALETHVWLWDRVVAEHKQVIQVQFHALSRTYLVKNIKSGELRSFRSLAEALEAAGILEDMSVLKYDVMNNDKSYAVRLRGSLDIESLPTPIRLLAYVSSSWDMDNEWYQWRLAR
jgi:hypothetical protein